LSLGLRTGISLPFANVNASSTYTENSIGAGLDVAGKVVVTNDGLTFANSRGTNGTGLIIRAFNDRNRNGEKDGGEEVIGYPDVELGSYQVARDRSGEFVEVQPHQSYTVQLGRWDYAHLNLFPGKLRYDMYVLPNTVYTIDVPYSEGLDVTGQCELKSREGYIMNTNIFNALRIKLRSTNGAYEYDAEVFDGGFLVAYGVAKGEYTIEFYEQELQSRKIKPAASMPSTVVIDESTTELPVLLFEPFEGIN
jgi:hypothetical protein